MWKNYLAVGFRIFVANKTYAFVNIFGLALGLAATVMILIYVRYELSYDRWLPGAQDLYQFQTHYLPKETGGEEMKLQLTSIVSGEMLVKDFPQIEKKIYVISSPMVVIQNGQASRTDECLLVDGNLFDFFQLPFVKGNPKTALDQPNTLVLTEQEAVRRFGAEDPIGKTLTVILMGEHKDYRVTGVVRKPPGNSHLSFDMVGRHDPAITFAKIPESFTNWYAPGGYLYVTLKPGSSADAIRRQLPAWEKRNIADDTQSAASGKVSNPGDSMDFHLVNVRDVHLGEGQVRSMTPGNDMRTIATFAIVALLILGMAVVNFTNLATARASQRAREVALRKVLGASRRQLIIQFLGESILVTALAMMLGLTMVELLLPSLNRFLDAEMALTYLGGDGFLLPILILVLLVGIAGGLYPAVHLSRFQPARILKANRSAGAEGSGRLRSTLVISQFAVSIGLIICTIVIYMQTVHARTADAGYKRDGLIQMENLAAANVQAVVPTLKREIAKIHGVEAVSQAGITVNPDIISVGRFIDPRTSEVIDLGNYNIEPDFIPTMGMTLLAGRNFSEANALDDATAPSPGDPAAEQALAQRGYNMIVSALAAQRLGFRTPEEAVGKQVRMPTTFGTIIGVVKDARFRSVRDPLQPMVFFSTRDGHYAMVVRYRDSDPASVLQAMERVWKSVLPDLPFTADLLDDQLRKYYTREQALGQLFAAFAALAVFISCLGLLGLAAFTAERRTKEIGIRKVLGARSRDIVGLLAWQFSKPVIVANIIAWPVAWWIMRDWLNNFDDRIALGPTPFLAAGALAVAIAIGTIAGHALKVARANPINALRYE